MTHLEKITHILKNHDGYSNKERKIWSKLAEGISEENQARLAESIRLYSEQLPADIRNELERENIAETLEEAFIEAQYTLTDPEETSSFVKKVEEGYQKIEKNGVSEEAIKSIINKIENEDDALKILVGIGPEGIEEVEELIIDNFLNGDSTYSLEEVLDLLHHFVHTKNIIAEENHKFMINIIETYNKGLQRAQEIQRNKVERANQLFDQLLEN